jgi:hypothetical protein
MKPEWPEWWNYPRHCAYGHVWRPGTVIVSWVVCGCAGDGGGGHLRVQCRVRECPSVWYKPAHQPGTEVTGRPGGLGGPDRLPGPAGCFGRQASSAPGSHRRIQEELVQGNVVLAPRRYQERRPRQHILPPQPLIPVLQPAPLNRQLPAGHPCCRPRREADAPAPGDHGTQSCRRARHTQDHTPAISDWPGRLPSNSGDQAPKPAFCPRGLSLRRWHHRAGAGRVQARGGA